MSAVLSIRRVTVADCADIIALQSASWRAAYRGILPDEYMGEALESEMRQRWQGNFARDPNPEFVLAALRDGALAGLIAIWRQDGAGFIDNLHVRPDLRGQRIGHALMAEAGRRLHAAGIGMAWLTVFTLNAPAVRFYDSMGGTPTERIMEMHHGKALEVIRYEWTDLARLGRAG